MPVLKTIVWGVGCFTTGMIVAAVVIVAACFIVNIVMGED